MHSIHSDPTMKQFRLYMASLATAILALSGCNKLEQPTAGAYRAHVTLRGGEVPVQMQLADTPQGLTLSWQDANRQTVSVQHLQISDGALSGQLPEQLGSLQAQFSANQLNGEIKMTDQKGQSITLPFAADLNQSWRFVEQSTSDNADISGDWQIEAISTDHFNAPVTVHLVQQFDQVNGALQLPDGHELTIVGQVHGDEVYLGGLGWGRAVLLKGKVNTHGELQGDAWVNLSAAHPWVARHVTPNVEPASAERTVALPWNVPTRSDIVAD